MESLMTQSQPEIRGFKHVFTVIGAIYILLASSWIVRGPGVLRDFAVSERVIAEPDIYEPVGPIAKGALPHLRKLLDVRAQGRD